MPCLSLEHIWRSRASNKAWRTQRRMGRRFNAGLQFSARRLAAELILAEYPTIMLQSRQAFKKPFIYKSKKLSQQPLAPQAKPSPIPQATSVAKPNIQTAPHIVNIVTPGAKAIGPRTGWRELTHADLINAESRLGSTILALFQPAIAANSFMTGKAFGFGTKIGKMLPLVSVS